MRTMMTTVEALVWLGPLLVAAIVSEAKTRRALRRSGSPASPSDSLAE
jgi:hypothetical protein